MFVRTWKNIQHLIILLRQKKVKYSDFKISARYLEFPSYLLWGHKTELSQIFRMPSEQLPHANWNYFNNFRVVYLLVFTCHVLLKFITFEAICHSCSHKISGARINRITEKLSSRWTETESKENIHSTESEEDNTKVY